MENQAGRWWDQEAWRCLGRARNDKARPWWQPCRGHRVISSVQVDWAACCSHNCCHPQVLKPKPKGRPAAITPTMYKRLSSALNMLQRQANGTKEVTVAMVKTKAGCSACTKTIRKAFHAHGIRFRRLREKPILTKDDIKDRLRFGLRHELRSKARWAFYPHAIIDNKNFPLYLNAAGREYALGL